MQPVETPRDVPTAPTANVAASGPDALTNYHTPARGRLARLIIVLCFGITLLATMSIYWRWATVTEPTSFIFIEGDDSHDGTLVVINRGERTDPLAMTTLSKANNYAVTIFLHPGTYTITATLNGEDLVNGKLLVGDRRWTPIKLKSRKPKLAQRAEPDLS